MEKSENKVSTTITNDIQILNVEKNSYFTVIVNKKLDSAKFCSPEEILIDLLFKYHLIKYKKIEHFSDEINLFFGKIPVIYTLNDIIDNKNLTKFIIGFFHQKDDPFIPILENLLYILKEVYKIAFDYLVFIKNKEKINVKFSIFEKFKNFFKNDNTYENNIKIIFDNYSRFNDNNEFYTPLEQKANTLIFYTYNLLMEIYFNQKKKKEYTSEYKKRELFLNVLIYAYIKEEIDNPNITHIYNSNKKVNSFKNDIINFIENEVNRKINNKNTNTILNSISFKLTEDMLRNLKKDFCIKNFNAEKQQINLIEKQLDSNLKNHLITLSIFIGTAFLFYWLSNKQKSKKVQKKQIAPSLINEKNLLSVKQK